MKEVKIQRREDTVVDMKTVFEEFAQQCDHDSKCLLDDLMNFIDENYIIIKK